MIGWLLDFYDEIETFHLFLACSLAIAWLALFLMFAIPNSNLIVQFTTPVSYRELSVLQVEAAWDWEQFIANLSRR